MLDIVNTTLSTVLALCAALRHDASSRNSRAELRKNNSNATQCRLLAC